jgi:hypothetical protein
MTESRLIHKPEYLHSLLVAEAERRNLPEAYQRDVYVHDLDQLKQYQTQEFIWCVRTCGSFLWPLDQFTAGEYSLRHNYPDKLIESVRHFCDEQMYFYHVKDGQMREVTLDEAKQIAEEAVSTHYRMARLARELKAKLEIERLNNE